eukprot:CAMPEP_0206173440 /NCGR_PEP_ID=MMETSP1474-20131121/48874_1 /ASSEMBLY_ACC=CAM_ASM_001110 /TAXON_ID=97495 /ORGANISM="Imantonia sp., Strain RCC918" /LENGTH=63 /DNA_ID=CAMNT_0053582287 /DNA_START=14 /DNA_END=202 /DNA_ORIENTATION=-
MAARPRVIEMVCACALRGGVLCSRSCARPARTEAGRREAESAGVHMPGGAAVRMRARPLSRSP